MSERHILRCTCGAWRYQRLACSTCANLTTRYAKATAHAGHPEAQAKAKTPPPTLRKKG